MLEYLSQWGTLYLAHFGAWVSFCVGTSIWKSGLPTPKEVKSLMISAVMVSAILGAFSSHSHHSYVKSIAKMVKNESK